MALSLSFYRFSNHINGLQKQKRILEKLFGKKKAAKEAQKAFSLAKSVLRGQTTSFIYNFIEEEE